MKLLHVYLFGCYEGHYILYNKMEYLSKNPSFKCLGKKEFEEVQVLQHIGNIL